MTSKLFNRAVMAAVALLGVLLISVLPGQAASAAPVTAAAPSAAKPQVKNLGLDSKSRPRVLVSTERDIEVLLEQTNADRPISIFPQEGGTEEVYHLKRVKTGTSATWLVETLHGRTGKTTSSHTFTWWNWEHHFQPIQASGGQDVYAEVSPNWGGKLRVQGGAPRVYVLDKHGTGRWERMTEAFGHDGDLVFVMAVPSGARATTVSTKVVYGAKPKITTGTVTGGG